MIVPLRRLKSRLSVLEQHLEVGLVPLASLGGGLERIRLTTVRVVAVSRGIAGTIRLATGLDPDKGVDEGVASGGRRAHTEAGAVDVAPVTPLLAKPSDTVAGGVDNGLAGHASGLELGREEADVELLVLGLVVLAVGGAGELAGAQVEGVPAGDVGGDTADLLGASGRLVDLGELLGTGLCWAC
jgi:hypothetical protein